MKKLFRKPAEHYINKLLHQADITANGDRPWDIQINHNDFFRRVVLRGSLGLGESYVDKWWECEALDQFFFKILYSDLHYKTITNLPGIFHEAKSRLFNRQNRKRAYQVGEHHYDAGNDLFELMLGKHMAYSCGYWRRADNLDAAQYDKLDIICQKLNLTPGMRILDIGCGWGSLIYHAARHYGVEAVGITVSKEQVDAARQRCAGLPVEVRLQDYRDISEKFDVIASVGMIEHVGYKNYPHFFQVARKCLRDDGLFLLHTIASNRSQHNGDPWLERYIFPNGMLPSISQLGMAIEEFFVMEDWHNLGVDYDRTLVAWYHNFADSWEKIKSKYSERFFRMWRYYLLCLAGAFRARHTQVWQLVLSPGRRVEGYRSFRCPQCKS